MTANVNIISKNARLIRDANGFSQTIVADFLNVDQSLISKFEKGERSINTDQLEKLANLYGCRISDFNNEDFCKEQYAKTAFRSSKISASDLQAIHDIKRIALNCFFMTELLESEMLNK